MNSTRIKQNTLRIKLGIAKGFDPLASSTIIGSATIAKKKNDKFISTLPDFYPDFGLEIASIVGEKHFDVKFEGLNTICAHLSEFPSSSFIGFRCDRYSIRGVNQSGWWARSSNKKTAMTLEFRLRPLSISDLYDKNGERVKEIKDGEVIETPRLEILKGIFEKTYLPKIEKSLQDGGLTVYASWLRRFKPPSGELVVPIFMLPTGKAGLELPIMKTFLSRHSSVLTVQYAK